MMISLKLKMASCRDVNCL